MKYVEQMKSIFLTLLVILSVMLTFSIWTYTPNYETNKQAPVVNISIAESKRVDDVVKPYKIIASVENGLTGTMEPFKLNEVVKVMKGWKVNELTLESNHLSESDVNELITKSKRFTLFFPDDVPFPVYDIILPFSITNIPESGFDRLIVDWSSSSNGNLKLFFVSSKNNTLYSAIAENIDSGLFKQKVIDPATVQFTKYMEIERKGKPSLFVSAEDAESIRYTYYLKEIDTNRFRDALFNDPSLVRQSPVGSSNEEYSDDTSLMNVDLRQRTLSFVNPSAETFVPGLPSKLIFNSLDYVNEHGGWTDEFRYAGINAANQQIDYQLYLLGSPVFSDQTLTKITAFWGDPGIYRYVRPYYTLDLSLTFDTPFDTLISTLPSGEKATLVLKTVKEIDFNKVEEMTIGYYLTRDDEQRLLILEPSWFYKYNNQWSRLSPEVLGGGQIGLE